ncbi:MAG: tetratricopeptide repeat protein [Candidatus Omnitrophota bacterium]
MKALNAKSLAIIAICCLGAAVYFGTFGSSFHFDDSDAVINNGAIRDLSRLQHVWDHWPTRFVTYFTVAVNYRLNGLDVFGYHLFNLAVHLGSAVLVWWIVLLTFSTPEMKGKDISGRSGLIALFAGLIFAAHPVQTQAVTYIIQRAVSMATFFYLASLALYVKAGLSRFESPSSKLWRAYYFSSLAAALMAIFTKEMAITLPFAILLYEFAFFSAGKGLGRRRCAPYFTALVIMPLTMFLTKSVNFIEMRRAVDQAPGISPAGYFLTQFKVIATYMRLALLPVNQNLDYDYPVANTLFEPSVLAGILLSAVILAVAVKLFRNYRLISFGILWFFLTLIPESFIIPIKDVIFEHRLYLPMFGYSMVLAAAPFYAPESGRAKAALTALVCVLVAAYAILAYQRNMVWKDEFTLWNDVARKSPHKARPYNNRGVAYEERGDIDRAIADYDRAIELSPNYADAYNNRGNAYGEKGDFGRAIDEYNKAIKIDADSADAYNNRGNIYSRKGNYEQAIADYNKAIEIKPDHAEAFNDRGVAFDKKGRFDLAATDLDRAILINPEYADAYNNRGNIFRKRGFPDRAIADYNRAIKIDPKYADAYCNRGNAYAAKEDFDRAITDNGIAIEMDPGYAKAYNGRGAAYAEKRDFTRAIVDYTKAIELDPKYAEAYGNRGIAHGKSGDLDTALTDITRAIELNPNYAEAYMNRGVAYGKKDNIASAIADLTKAIEIKPDYADAYYTRALAYLYTKDVENARKDLLRAKELGHDIPEDLSDAMKG